MRALITGAAGFLGSHLTDALLAEGHEVLGVDNLCTGSLRNLAHLKHEPRFNFLEQDICAPFDPKPVEYVFNFASPASPADYMRLGIETLMVGSTGTRNMLDIAQKCGAKFLHASTSECYGDPDEHPQTEEYWGNVNPIGPRSCYDEGKRCAETLFFDYYRQHRLAIKVARIFNTYGPRMHPNDGRVVSNFVVQALKGEPVTLFGDGGQTRSFCYVDDLVEALVRLMNSPLELTGPVNLGNPREFTVRQLAEMVIRLTGSRSKIEFRPLPTDDPKQRQPDIALARKALEWGPKTELEEGLKATIAYFRALLDA